jgi:hypothetical protein
VAAGDAWVVGFNGAPGAYQAWTFHWDGTSWSNIPAAQPGQSNQLLGLSLLSSRDGWAVGDSYTQGIGKTLVEHWDGSSWTQVPSPNPGRSVLYGAAALSPTDAWAVGFHAPAGVGQRSLILHWDGTSWTQVPAPSPLGATGVMLTRISVVSPTQAWALGSYVPRSGPGTPPQTFLLHWDGSTWKRVDTPETHLADLAAVGPQDAWAVGMDSDGAITDHWDGASLTSVSNPAQGAGTHLLLGLGALSPSDIWAVGTQDYDHTEGAMILHWDGRQWTSVPCWSPPNTFLFAVSASSDNDAWAIGLTGGTGVQTAVLDHWDGRTWTHT